MYKGKESLFVAIERLQRHYHVLMRKKNIPIALTAPEVKRLISKDSGFIRAYAHYMEHDQQHNHRVMMVDVSPSTPSYVGFRLVTYPEQREIAKKARDLRKNKI